MRSFTGHSSVAFAGALSRNRVDAEEGRTHHHATVVAVANRGPDETPGPRSLTWLVTRERQSASCGGEG
jgi:hypothetical protein